MKNLFTRVFVGSDGDIAKLQNEVNQWVAENRVIAVDYKLQMTASEFEGYPFVVHSIMIVYEAEQPILVQEQSAETEESHESELVAAADDDLPY